MIRCLGVSQSTMEVGSGQPTTTYYLNAGATALKDDAKDNTQAGERKICPRVLNCLALIELEDNGQFNQARERVRRICHGAYDGCLSRNYRK